MAIVASLPGINLFSNLPTNPPPNDPSHSHPPKPPIPIPKYPPTPKSQRYPPLTTHKNPERISPAFKSFHRRSKYYKPVRDGVISSDGDRSVVVGESGVSYQLPGAPFEFQFSYSEVPKVKPLAIREPAFLPFAPPTMPRPWTGKAPLKKRQKNIKLFESFRPEGDGDGAATKHMEMLKPYELGNFEAKAREKVIGSPLRKAEIKELIKKHVSSNRQVNLGRDGLTHNMLELIHTHWRRDPVCKVRCLGVPTVDMNNVCRCLEEKTGGKIIHRAGGVLYVFRGRHYNPRTRPRYPVMLWKPATPVYPKLIQEAPEGLTKAEADELRMKGKNLRPICKLGKNKVYITLVKEVKYAFEGSLLVKIDCRGMHASDYKKIGAKLKELVPCVLLSFEDEQILMWRGHDWKSMFQDAPGPISIPQNAAEDLRISGNTKVDPHDPETKTVCSSPRMMSLWKQAIESSKALLLEDPGLGPDDLLKVVDDFNIVSQATEHSYPAVIVTSEDQDGSSDGLENYSLDDDEAYGSDSDADEYYIDDSSAPLGSLPVDSIANKLLDRDSDRDSSDSGEWKSNTNWR